METGYHHTTDNTAIRVGFMISVAVGSVMRITTEYFQERM